MWSHTVLLMEGHCVIIWLNLGLKIPSKKLYSLCYSFDTLFEIHNIRTYFRCVYHNKKKYFFLLNRILRFYLKKWIDGVKGIQINLLIIINYLVEMMCFFLFQFFISNVNASFFEEEEKEKEDYRWKPENIFLKKQIIEI